jgi:hypothetical protein
MRSNWDRLLRQCEVLERLTNLWWVRGSDFSIANICCQVANTIRSHELVSVLVSASV